jgi:glutamine cyclotransferase
MKTGYQLLRFMRAISVAMGIAVFLAACAGTNTATPTKPFVSIISPIATSPVHSLTPQPVPVYPFKVVNSYPHDPTAFTEGLVFDNGNLYESTGLNGHSTLRRVDLASGKVLQSVPISA